MTSIPSVNNYALLSHLIHNNGMDRCRICLTELNDGHIKLSDEIVVEYDRNYKLLEILSALAGRQVIEDDELPNGVCAACVNQAVPAFLFRTFCLQSIETWTQALENLEKITPLCLDLKLKKNYPIHTVFVEIKDEDIIVIPDRSTNGQYNDAASAARSLRKRLAKSKWRNKSRQSYNNKDFDLTFGDDSQEITDGLYQCESCTKTFKHPSTFVSHLKGNTEREACKYCGEVFPFRSTELIQHFLEVHKKIWYRCDICPLIFSSKTVKELHELDAHNEKTFTCIQCGQTCRNKDGLIKHMAKHKTKCPGCNQIFSSKACYLHHRNKKCIQPMRRTISIDSNGKQKVRLPVGYHCDYCGKKKMSKLKLIEHIKADHEGNRMYHCNKCGKKFVTLGQVKSHSVVHTRERNFICTICGLGLVTNRALKCHIWRHKGEKPYQCEICGKSFTTSSQKTSHRKRHLMTPGSSERPNPCPDCNYRFMTPGEVRRHLKRVHKYVDVDIKMEETALS